MHFRPARCFNVLYLLTVPKALQLASLWHIMAQLRKDGLDKNREVTAVWCFW